VAISTVGFRTQTNCKGEIKVAKEKLFEGGEFLITDALPDEVFTPEDFNLEQRMIARSAEDFGVRQVDAVADELEELNPELLKRLLRDAAELGLLGADVPEIYGGTDLDKVSMTLITEHLSRGGSGFSVSCAVHTGIGSLPLVLFGSAAQKEKYLSKLATAEMIGAYALTEPEHGSDALGAETTAMLSEDGKYYILNGQKQFITNAGLADLFITYAQVNGDQFTGFIVERKWEGVSLDQEEKKMGVHGTSTRAVIFQNVRVPVENVLGEVGRGHVVALNALNVGRYKLAASTLGGCKLLISQGVKWAKNRIQFGKPICEFGLIRQKIAQMVIRTYVSESMVYRTARLLDLALESVDANLEDAGEQTGQAIRKYALECSINKVYASEAYDYVADECVQIMGGYGYIQGNVAESAYRDSRINRIWEGTNEINRLLIVNLLMKSAMSGKLPLFETVKKVTSEVLGSTPNTSEDEGPLGEEGNILAAAKKMTLFAAGAAARKYMQNLAEEQEVDALIADSMIEIFAMESALLRTRKKIAREGEEKSATQVAVTRVYINDSFPKVNSFARQILAAIYTGEELNTQLKGLDDLAGYTPVNTVALRREIADSIVPVARYHLTAA
jgi:alkylation response protein AidB-like acyl-CoA dehydrogenase